MKTISAGELQRIAEQGDVLAADDDFVRAVRDRDGRIWKQFRKKSLPSSAAIRPYAKRFARSAQLLNQCGIRSVHVRDMYRVIETGRYVVVYDELPGRTFRTVLESDGVQRLADFAGFMALLHERGLYFRSMHLDNVLLTDDGDLALIDVTYVQFTKRMLNPWRRARNFKPVTSYAADRALIEQFGINRFLEHYLAAAALDERRRRQFLMKMQRLNTFLAGAAKQLLSGGITEQDANAGSPHQRA